MSEWDFRINTKAANEGIMHEICRKNGEATNMSKRVALVWEIRVFGYLLFQVLIDEQPKTGSKIFVVLLQIKLAATWLKRL